MFPKIIVRVDVKSVEDKHGVKLDEVNNHVKLNGVKSNDRSVIVEVDVHAQFTNKQEFIVSNKI